jgi:hypothetical protein
MRADEARAPGLAIIACIAAGAASVMVGCHAPLVVASREVKAPAPIKVVAQDATPAEDMRLMPAEAYLRTYLQLAGGGPPLDVQQRARGNDNARLFDNWNDYAAALGLPDHRNDLPRASETNALMIATFDRLAIALCVRAALHDLRGNLPPGQRQIFAFAGVPAPTSAQAFLPAFDVLHRTFLSYPAALAPAQRSERFFSLFRATWAHHEQAPLPKPRLTPVEAGWAAVCVGLARHPEFHVY